jgi:serine/threonine protein kinase
LTDVQTHTGLLLGERYRLEDLLARGALCQVYRGTDDVLHRPVAIKSVAPEHAEAYRNALRLTAALTHPTIVYVLDAIEHESWYYLVQEMVSGTSLAAHMQKGLSVERALDVALQLARCLAHAHQHSVAHGDLTPTSVLLERHGSVRLNNFALPPDREYFASLPETSELLTHALDIQASAPESSDEPLAVAADVRALGLLMWHVLSAPEDGGDRRDFRADVPLSVRQMVARMLVAGHPQALSSSDGSVPELEALLRDVGAAGDEDLQSTPPALRALRHPEPVDPAAAAWAAADTVVDVPPPSWGAAEVPPYARPSAYDTGPTRPAIAVPPARAPLPTGPVRTGGLSGPLRAPVSGTPRTTRPSQPVHGPISTPMDPHIPPSRPSAYRPTAPLPWSDEPAVARWATEGTGRPRLHDSATSGFIFPARRSGAGVIPVVLIGLALFIICFLIGYFAPLVIR